MNIGLVEWGIVSQTYFEMSRRYIMADLADEDLRRMVMMAKERSLESIGVQQLNPPVTNTDQNHDADDWVLTGISSCCMGQHPPSLCLRHCYMAVHLEFRWARLPSIADGKARRAFDRFHS